MIAVTQDIMGFFVEYATEAVLVALGFIVCYVAWLLYYKKKRVSELKEIRTQLAGFFLLAFYLYMVLGITILSRIETPTRELYFELFRTFRNTFMAKKQICENILMFVPFSMLLYWLTPGCRKWWKIILLGAGCSLVIEVTQWITMTGCFEVDDILTNTMGMILGYLISGCMIRIRNLIKNWKRSHA